MPETTEQPTNLHDDARDTFSSDLESLHNSFSQLREDVTTLVTNALGAAKSGADALKDRGSESMEQVGDKISEQPLLSAAIVFGAGFLLAKLLFRK
jgi:ElaB/YqjD/DUF883 family membrane-anchored ribosome-binding protein